MIVKAKIVILAPLQGKRSFTFYLYKEETISVLFPGDMLPTKCKFWITGIRFNQGHQVPPT